MLRSLDCLAAGGIAVHTSEYQIAPADEGVERGPTVLFRRPDVEQLAALVERAGHRAAPIDWSEGEGALDRYVDLPPYHRDPHLRLWLEGNVCTSIGLIVGKRR